jgi:hypothetical protein
MCVIFTPCFLFHYKGTNPLTGGGGIATGVCKDAIPNCDQYGTSVCADPQYSGWVSSNCRKFCNKCGMCDQSHYQFK